MDVDDDYSICLIGHSNSVECYDRRNLKLLNPDYVNIISENPDYKVFENKEEFKPIYKNINDIFISGRIKIIKTVNTGDSINFLDFPEPNIITRFYIYELCKRLNLDPVVISRLWNKFLEVKVSPFILKTKEIYGDDINEVKFFFKIVKDLDNVLTEGKCGRTYLEGRWNFVQFILSSKSGNCNCSCGSIGLVSLLSSYSLFKHPLYLCTRRNHIFIAIISDGKKFCYETTLKNGSRGWTIIRKCTDGIIRNILHDDQEIVLNLILNHCLDFNIDPFYETLVPDFKNILNEIKKIKQETHNGGQENVEKYQEIFKLLYETFKNRYMYYTFIFLLWNILSTYDITIEYPMRNNIPILKEKVDTLINLYRNFEQSSITRDVMIQYFHKYKEIVNLVESIININSEIDLEILKNVHGIVNK